MDKRLESYARLVIEVGVNVQKGDPVMISCPIEHIEFARLLHRFAYERGASEVVMNWRDDCLTRMKYEHEPLETFEQIPDWVHDRLKYYYEKGVNVISVSSSDPSLLQGIDPVKISAASKANNQKLSDLDHYTMNDENSWCVVALPNAAWARKVYPDIEDEEEAVNKLWKKILEVTRMNEKDPVRAWKEHIDRLSHRAALLNEYHFQSVHYSSSNGTDLEVRLPDRHIWLAATSDNKKGTTFLPNIPTEEVFTAPHREGVDGTLVATKPLAYNGQIIDGFVLHFENGKVVDFSAKKGAAALKALLAEDENARHLGEIALVPYDSPISRSNLLFYNTLFDENASCHFAFGACYPTTLERGTELSEEELKKEGGNSALVHEDFMVGSKDLSIIGTKQDGSKVTVFKDGNFAF